LIPSKTELLIQCAFTWIAELFNVRVVLAYLPPEKHYERMLYLGLRIYFFEAADQSDEGFLSHGDSSRVLTLEYVVACLIGLKASRALASFPKSPSFHVASDRQVIGSEFGDVSASARPDVFQACLATGKSIDWIWSFASFLVDCHHFSSHRFSNFSRIACLKFLQIFSLPIQTDHSSCLICCRTGVSQRRHSTQ
jgi:hypothetical protein